MELDASGRDRRAEYRESALEGVAMSADGSPMPEFRRSTFCNSNGGCVEVAREARGASVRDGKNSDSPVLRFTEIEWRAFVQGVRAGEFD